MYEESEIPSEVSFLLRSAVYNNIKGVKRALKLKADVNSSGPDLVTPLHIASEKGYVELAKYLVTVNGIELDKQTVYGNTPLLLSVYHNHIKITNILLKAGADPNAMVIFDQTVLHIAAFHGRLRSVELLIRYNADVNVVDCFDRTPLYMSLISYPSATITYVLLKAGANPNYRTKLQQSLLSLVCLGAHNMIQVQAISTLIYFGANIFALDVKKESCLHKAAMSGYTPLINLLVKKGANLFIKNVWGQTPMDIAKIHKNKDAIALFEELEDEYIYGELMMLNLSQIEL